MRLSMLLIFLAHFGLAQDLKLFFPELDAILITIWEKADEGKCSVQLRHILNDNWLESRPILVKNVSKSKSTYLLDYLDELVNSISDDISTNRLRYARSNSYELLRQLRMIRRAYTSYVYPLDLLFDTYESYQEVDYTVHDRMFGLYEWFEFKDLLILLDDNWKTYNTIDTSDLTFYFPGIDMNEHQVQKTNFDTCLTDFYKSLETGYQSKFQMPCDEMGQALRALIGQYRQNLVDKNCINRL